MAYEEATVAINSIHLHLAGLAKAIVVALDDNKISAGEGMMVGMRGMNTAIAIMTLIKMTTPQVRKEILHVLEHGEWTMPKEYM